MALLHSSLTDVSFLLALPVLESDDIRVIVYNHTFALIVGKNNWDRLASLARALKA